MITLHELREFTKDMHDDTRLGMSFDEEAQDDLLTFQQPGSEGGEELLDIGRLEPHSEYEE